MGRADGRADEDGDELGRSIKKIKSLTGNVFFCQLPFTTIAFNGSLCLCHPFCFCFFTHRTQDKWA